MAISYVNKSAFASGTGALSVGAVSGVVANDLILLFVESANQNITTPSGFTQVTNSPVSTGTAAAAGGVRLAVFYQFATGADGTTSVADSGDHTTAIKMAFRGVNTTTPFDATPVSGVKTPASTTATFPGITTATANAWIVHASGLDRDAASTTTVGTATNANLTGITEHHDQTISSGVGGGLVVITGTKATAGATGNTTATVTSTIQVYLTLALREAAPVQALQASISATGVVSATLTTIPGTSASITATATATATLSLDPDAVELVEILTGTTTVTPVLAEAGDLMLAMAFRDGSATLPTLPSGWTQLATQVGATCCALLASRSTVGAGVFTNATSVICHVYRSATASPLTVGNIAGATGTGSTVSLPAVTLASPAAGPFRVGFAGHVSPSAVFPETGSSSVSAVLRSLGFSAFWLGTAYGDGTFVFLGLGTVAATSPDGVTWTQRTLPTSGAWYGVAYGNGRFVAVANGTASAMTSTDGVTWTPRTLPVSGDWYHVTFGPAVFGAGTFVVVGSNSNVSLAGTDGVNWTAGTMPATRAWYNVGFGNDTFVALGYNSNQAAISTDGVNWTAQTLPSTRNWRDVAYGSGLFVAIVDSGTNVYATSPDGVTWIQRTLPVSKFWHSIVYGGGAFLITGNDTSLMSNDGLTWTQVTMPMDDSWSEVSHGAGVFVTAITGSTNNTLATIQAGSVPLARRRASIADATDVVASYDSGGPELQTEV